LLEPVNRRAFLRTGATSIAILSAAPVWCGETKPEPPSDSELLSHAQASIERYRKAEATVQMQNLKGEPIPNVRVKLEQLRHEFLFGCNLFLFDRCPDAERETEYRAKFADLFNYCTLGFYWAAYERQRGKPGYDYTDRVLEWTRKNEIACKGHPLVWDHPAGSPQWLPNDPAEIAAMVTERITSLVTRYRGKIGFWDVVNEATHLPQRVNRTVMGAWGADMEQVAYAAEPLRIARAADPGATLLINDYRIEPAYFELLARLRHENKHLFDVVGIQSHMHDAVWPLHKVYSICEQYSKFRLPIHFTETTILSGVREKSSAGWTHTTSEGETAQATHTAFFYTVLFAQPAVQAITWWDFSDEQAWQGAPAGLLRQDMSAKPAYEQLRALIKRQWWTNAEASSDERGVCSFRAFHGMHRVTAGEPGKAQATGQLVVGRGKPNQITLTI
jgi:endo-1,4-beta-xylanase